jgi:hypothetical protein
MKQNRKDCDCGQPFFVNAKIHKKVGRNEKGGLSKMTNVIQQGQRFNFKVAVASH